MNRIYTHIIWDFDGTLFDTYRTMAEVFRLALAEQGYHEPLEEILAAMKVSMSCAMEQYKEKVGISDAFIAAYRTRKRAAELEQSKPFAGAYALCRDICAAGSWNYLCTHRSRATAYALLEKYGMDDFFRDGTTSEDAFERKPSPQAVQHLMARYHMRPADVLMVGDRELDILAGKHAGADACFFAGQGGESAHADYTVTTMAELYALLGISKGNQ